MPDFRFEPLTRRWVITGGDRDTRPNEYCDSVTKRSDLSCPFCAGNEEQTPPTVQQYPSDRANDWLVRVVPNKYPAVNGSGPYQLDPRPAQVTFELQPGRGVHEVIIETPRHAVDLTDLSDDELTHTFRAYRDRLISAGEQGLVYAQVFKNVGPAAGASLEHSHSQVIGLPWLPVQLEEQLRNSREYYSDHRQPLLAHLLREELKSKERIVGQQGELVAWCPFASRFAFECWIAARTCQSDFRQIDDRQLAELAVFARDIIRRVKQASGQSAYNLILFSQPLQERECLHFQWYWQILPRGAKQAGFEWATGHFVNPCLPESAASAINSLSN